ncbi:Ig-like domain-containing protein [Sandaracinus amylolyticus]|uniref:SbsA Ig-like domain-containing protein n=1 Tax=Sandaracinus amylolyticus TaxID=927083 RepID=A0A0F6W8G0_9BACT|nr:Ig-like domain-containing protein [Sandaracinus amylolyticus]AKF10150.1 hypothetical protein DB32_007299 [Sandaracinus amylolyticus]
MARNARSSIIPCSLAVALVASACSGDDEPPSGDTTPPSVVEVSPPDGATGVAPDATLRVRFSEPMDREAGALVVRSGDTNLPLGAPSWNASGTELSVRPAAQLPSGAVSVIVDDDFTDVAGNPLAMSVEVAFAVVDLDPPRIVSSTPAEGETSSVGTTEIVFELSESVRGDLPSMTITGDGAPTLGTPSWSDARTLRVPVSGLVHEGAYRVTIAGVRDLAGNALDASALGEEGALDFTAIDDVAPVVTDSSPSEGQIDVAWDALTQVVVLFSEPMDPTAGSAALTVSGAATTLTGSWDMGGRRLLLDVTGRLENLTAHRVALEGYRDVAGNALDGTVRLVDGAIDFTTGDLYAPYVVSSTPAEGATDVAPSTSASPLEITITFSEAMDTSTSDVTIVGDGASITASGTWSIAGTSLTVPVGARLNAGASYSIDLTAFRDATGTLLDASHEGLADGALDFALRAPTGERCGDALTNAQGVSIDGALEWLVANEGVIADDGAITCMTSELTLPDGVIRYRKTTPSLSAGGTALHVTVGGYASFEVTAGTCELPASAGPLRCSYMSAGPAGESDTWLDVGPGDYYVWINNYETFGETMVRIAEDADPRDGESCLAPYDGATDATIYTAPASADGEHVWVVPEGLITGMDRTVTPSGALSCDPTTPLGHDMVVAFDKTRADSLVTIDVVPFGNPSPFGPTAHIDVEVARGGCDPTTAGRTVAACETRLSPESGGTTITLDGPAGRLDTWLVAPQQASGPGGLIEGFVPFPGATVRVSEFTPGLGDTCANAIRLSPGTNNVMPDRTHRAYAPSCLREGGLTWYRYTPTRNLAIVRTNAATGGAVVAADGTELGCGADLGEGLLAATTAGQDVCIAMQSSAAITSLAIEELDFGGVRGVETDLGVRFPATGAENVGLYNVHWMVTTPSHLVLGLDGEQIATAPRAGGADFSVSVAGLSPRTLSFGAILDGARILGTVTGSGAMEPRLARVADAAGVAAAVPAFLDTPPTPSGYVEEEISAIARDGANVIVATTRSWSETPALTFYSIPLAGGPATRLGHNTVLNGAGGLAVDATYFYLTSQVGPDGGLYRLRRDALANPASPPELLVAARIDALASPVFLDPANDALYFRATEFAFIGPSTAHVWLVLDPDGAAGPRFAGPIWRSTAGQGMGFDPAGPSLFVIDVSSGRNETSRWLRLD